MQRARRVADPVQRLAVLVEAGVDGLEVFLRSLQRLLEGVLELCEGQRRRLGLCSSTCQYASDPTRDALTGCDLRPGRSEQIKRLLHVGDARRQVRAALEELHLLPEVVHGQAQNREGVAMSGRGQRGSSSSVLHRCPWPCCWRDGVGVELAMARAPAAAK